MVKQRYIMLCSSALVQRVAAGWAAAAAAASFRACIVSQKKKDSRAAFIRNGVARLSGMANCFSRVSP